MTPETKMGATGAEARAAAAELAVAFEAYKAANDARLREIEAKRAEDPLTSETLSRIDQALTRTQDRLDRLAIEQSRPALGAGESKSAARAEWAGFLRTGTTPRAEGKSLSVGVGRDGGHAAPPETEALIERLIREASPIRQIATVRQTSSHTFRKPVSVGGAVSGWVAETAARPETDASALELLEFPAAELYAMPAATPALLDDALADVEQWLAE